MKYNPFSSWFQTVAVFWLLYSFFWMIPQHLSSMSRRKGTLCSTFKGGVIVSPMKMEQTDCCETSANKIRTAGNHQKEGTQHTPFILYTSTVYIQAKDAVVVE
jgi:hypothetical protein